MVENRESQHELELRLIGPVRLLRRDGAEVTPKGRKAQGLLALLGVAPQHRRPRSWLQDKLWSDRGPEQGGQSLRQELTSLRRALGDANGCIVAEAGRIGLAQVRVVLEAAPEDWDLAGTPPEFCEGLDIADPEFEDWIREQRAHFEERLAAAPPPAPAPVGALFAQVRAPVVAEQMPTLIVPELVDELRPSIAVMPIEVIGGIEGAAYCATGIAQEVITRLTRYRRLDVIAHASTLALAPRQLRPREIGAALGVRYVVQGRLRLGPTRMKLDVHLISAENERLYWGETYDRSFEDIFDVETEVSIALTSAIMLEIDHQERARVRARDPSSLDAYGLCLRANDEMLRLDRAGCDSALRHFTRAEEREGHYARALSGISRAHGFYWKYRWIDDREAALARADDFAVEAVNADVNDPSANAALGWVALYDRKHERSLAAYQRAMELNPSDADILAEYADSLGHSGANEEAIPLFLRAMRLNPQMSDIYAKDLAYVYLKARQFDEAIQTIRRMRRPEIADATLAPSLALAGRIEEARAVAEAVRRHRPGFSPEAWVTMVPDLNADDTALLLDGMRRAGL